VLPGVVHRVPMSSPSRPKIPRISAWVVAPFDMPFGSPVVFGDGDKMYPYSRYSPAFQARDQLDLAVDPRLVHIGGIPQGSGGPIALELGGRRHIVAELASLRNSSGR